MIKPPPSLLGSVFRGWRQELDRLGVLEAGFSQSLWSNGLNILNPKLNPKPVRTGVEGLGSRKRFLVVGFRTFPKVYGARLGVYKIRASYKGSIREYGSYVGFCGPKDLTVRYLGLGWLFRRLVLGSSLN